MTKLLKPAALLFLLPALLLGACGQTEPVAVIPPPVVAPAPIASTLSLRVFLPAKPGVNGQYVSSATSSLRVQLGSFDATLALSAATCTAVTGGQTCTFSLNVTPGEGQTLTVSAYDASSHLLGTSTQKVSIVAGQDNPLALTLTGVAASASFTATDRAGDVTEGPSGSLLFDLGGPYTAGIALKDAAGQTILNPGRPTETVTSSDPTFTVTSTGVGSFSVLAPDPSGSAQSTTLTVRDAGGAVLATQVLTVPAERVVLNFATNAPVAGSSLMFTARLTSARGRPLPFAGRAVNLSTNSGFFDRTESATDTLTTDVAGMVSGNLYVYSVSGTSGTVTATSDGVSGSASYVSVAGTANTTSSSVLLSPDAVKVTGGSTLTVTLKDGNNNPVTTAPTVIIGGNTTLGAVAQSGNVFTYAVTAAAAPETATFTVTSGGNTVGSANLAISAYPLTVSNGAAALSSGSSQYDFQDGSAHTFVVAESNYSGVFTVNSSNTAAATASVSGGVLTVTPNSMAGFSTITMSDDFGQSFSFTVSVTKASVTIN